MDALIRPIKIIRSLTLFILSIVSLFDRTTNKHTFIEILAILVLLAKILHDQSISIDAWSIPWIFINQFYISRFVIPSSCYVALYCNYFLWNSKPKLILCLEIPKHLSYAYNSWLSLFCELFMAISMCECTLHGPKDKSFVRYRCIHGFELNVPLKAYNVILVQQQNRLVHRNCHEVVPLVGLLFAWRFPKMKMAKAKKAWYRNVWKGGYAMQVILMILFISRSDL